jgi:hypothetical protein
LSVDSTKKTDTHTSTPAIVPISTAAGAVTNAHGAVIATRPASSPLAIMLGSGLPKRAIMNTIAAIAPPVPASMVFTATTAMRKSVPASVEPGLKPNQPKARMKVPTIAIGMWCPGIATGRPSLVYLPRRGPSTIAPASAATPPTMCTTDEPAKSTWPWPRPKFVPRSASQPPPQTQLPNSGYTTIDMKNA